MEVRNYNETLDYLFSRLPMFSRIGKAALKPDLTNTIQLCEALGNPQQKFRSVHIAGTNGKGSTSHMLAAITGNAGYKTGLYTSPHLVDFTERIRINGEMIAQQWVVDFVHQHQLLIETINPSFFEITVAMAFQAFAEAGVDVAIIETGLGGRLDSTNIITPLLSIITNISYDHKDLLGDTLAAIASEKAGIIKPNVPVIIGEQHDETERVFFEHSVRNKSPLYYADNLWSIVKTGENDNLQHFKAINNAHKEVVDVATDLEGTYQQHNLKTVLTAAEILGSMGFTLGMDGVCAALKQVKQLTGFGGRWETLQRNPIVIADVAHNPAGLSLVFKQWNQVIATRKHIIVGFVKDKEVREALQLFPTQGNLYYYCNANIPRALPAPELAAIAAEAGLAGACYNSVAECIAAVLAVAATTDAILVTGSFFTVGEAMAYLNKE